RRDNTGRAATSGCGGASEATDYRSRRIMNDNGQGKHSDKAPDDEAAHVEVVAHCVPAQPESPLNANNGTVLVIDIGGTKVKMLVTGKTEPRKVASGPNFSPDQLVQIVRTLEPDWKFDVVTIGFPGLVGTDGPKSEPGSLGPGWVGFD